MKKTLKIATRKSPLALWQAQYVKTQLQNHHHNLQVELVKMTTKGDQMLGSPLAEIGGKGLFIKELEAGMLAAKADLAVHSAKDMPYKIPVQFRLAAILKRENPFDAFVSNNFNSILDLPGGAKIGTCSKRRIVQLTAIRPDLLIKDLRGNVNTRLKKLDDGEFDAIILACAGLIRLGFDDRITQQLSTQQSLPAVGQGAIGIEIRADDEQTLSLIRPLIDDETTKAVTAERAMNAKLQGGCSSPIAGFATVNKQQLTLTGLVGNVKTGKILKHQVCGDLAKSEALGIIMADKLLALGAKTLLQGL